MATYPGIKIKHSPVTTYPGTVQTGFVGAQNVVNQRGSLPSFNDGNSYYLAKTGSDSNAGTAASPKLTLGGLLSTVPGIIDNSGNGYNLTQVGGVPLVTYPSIITPPQGNTCAGPFASGNYFVCPSGLKTAMSGLTTWTVEGWFYVPAATTGTIWSWTDPTNTTSFIINSDGSVNFLLNGTNHGSSAGQVSAGNWYYFACSFNSGVTNGLRCWLGLSPSNLSAVIQTTVTYTIGSINNMRIGSNPSNSIAMAGYADRLYFSNVVRTTFPTAPTASNLLACYEFESRPLLQTANKSYVVIQDSSLYNEGMYANFLYDIPNTTLAIYAADGQTPTFELLKGAIAGTFGVGNPNRSVSGTPNYYVSKAGSDFTGTRGNASKPFKTIQGAINDAARQNGDVIQIQDSGIYQENINFGSTIAPGPLRAAAGQTPTLQALPVNDGNVASGATDTTTVPGTPYQVTPPVPGASFFGDLGVSYAGSYNGGVALVKVASSPGLGQYAVSGAGVYTFYSGDSGAPVVISYLVIVATSVANISWGINGAGPDVDGLVLNGAGATQYLHSGYGGTNIAFTNCTIENYGTLGHGTNGFFTNCVMRNIVNLTDSGGVQMANCYCASASVVSASLGLSFSGATNCTFVNMNLSGSSNSVGVVTVDRCIFQSGSLTLDDTDVAANTNYVVTNCVFSLGNVKITRGGTATNSTTVALNNLVIYAYGLSYGLTVTSAGGSVLVYAAVTNCLAVGATNNFIFTTIGSTSFMKNCSSIKGLTNGLSAAVGLLTVSGFADAGSATAWSGGIVPTFSESSAGMLSTVKGSENATLSAGDNGTLSGPVSFVGGTTSMGIHGAFFISQIPLTLNGLTLASFSNSVYPFGSQEGGVSVPNGQALQVSYCTFATSGPYAIKPTSNATINNCFFSECGGHAIESDASTVSISYSAAVSCGGAFLLNYGQNSISTHNSSYSCQYGEYDAPGSSGNVISYCVFSVSGTYDYSGDSSCTYSSIGTLDPVRNGFLGTGCIQLDPLFANASGGDLSLQSLARGYFWQSPCIGVGVGGVDMGAYVWTYGTQSIAWTLIDFATVLTGPIHYRNPDVVIRKEFSVKLAEGDREDGGIYSIGATYKPEYDFNWTTSTSDMPLQQLADLRAMFTSFSNQILIDFGDGRGYIPGFFARQQGFEYTDMTGLYSDNTTPEPLKTMTVREA